MKDKKISSVDDYYMMEEVLSRRLSKINQNDEYTIPDVIIVDGGRGQYNSVLKIIKKYQLKNIKLLSVSKGPDRNAGCSP